MLQGWERTYNGVNTCNRILSQIEEGVISVDGETKEKLIAELKVLRASYYYILIDLYGNVPIVTDLKILLCRNSLLVKRSLTLL